MQDMMTKDPLLENSQKPLDEIRDEDTIVKYLCTMLGEAEEGASSNISTARKNWHFVLGNHFLEEGLNNDWLIDESNPYWRTRLQRDILTPVVTTAAAVLHKLRPTLILEADFPGENVVAYFGEGQRFELPIAGSLAAGQFQRIMEHEWTSRNEEVLQAELLLDVIVQGMAWRTFMPVMFGNTWKVMPKLLDISQVLGDPDGCDLMNFMDFKYIAKVEMMDVADIERLYKVKEKDFARGPGKNENEPDFMGGDTGLFREYGWEHKNQRGIIERVTKRQRRKYPVYTIYYHQGCPDVFMHGQEPAKALRYPLGRQMVLINKKKLVQDIHNPYWHKKFPLTCHQRIPLPHKNFGLSNITQLVPVQEMVNILQNMILANAIVLGVPQWIVEDGAVEDAEITNEPGAIVHVRPGTNATDAVQRLDPRQSSDDLHSNLMDLKIHGQEDLGDMTEAIQGKAVTSNASGVLQNAALGAALTVRGFEAQMLDASHNRDATIETSMVQQYLHIDERQLQEMKDGGEYLEMNLAIRELFYDVKTESQAELPHNPQARLNWATHQLQMGFFDAEEYRLFTGMKVRPELERMLHEASGFFMPLVPLEMQAQVRTSYEMAKLKERLAEQGIDVGDTGVEGGGQESVPANDAAGERSSGVGPNTTTGPAGSGNQRLL